MKNISQYTFPLIIVLATICALRSPASAAPSNTAAPFEIKVKMVNYPDSLNHVLLLGKYYGNTQYITDTAKYNPQKNEYVFSSNQLKDGGLYLLISADKRFAEFIIDKTQKFAIETSFPNMGEKIKFTNSPENQIYMNFAEKGKTDYIEMDKLQKEFKSAQEAKDTATVAKLRISISKLFSDIEKYKDQFIIDNPSHLMAAIFKSQKDIDVPQAPANIADSLKREWQYEYYKEHYFDNFDLCDSRLLFTPMFHQKFDSWLEKVLYMQSPDTIKYAIERFIEKCRCNKENFKYAVWYPVDKYQRSEIIGQDAIWVHLAKKYYLKGDAYWASQSIVENFSKRIKRVEPTLIGNRPPEFACPDTSIGTNHENFISVFSSPKKYTIVVFWSISCGHCKKSMPKWLELYHEKGKELDFEIIAICKDSDTEEWKKYISEHKFDWINLCGKTATADYDELWDVISTPTVYILDRNKRIVTKKIDTEYAEDFIRIWERDHFGKK